MAIKKVKKEDLTFIDPSLTFYVSDKSAKKHKCPLGHEWQSECESTLNFNINNVLVASVEFCPFCLAEFIKENFPLLKK